MCGNNKQERGVALITALMLITLITAVIGSASAISIYMSREVSISVRDATTFYLAESTVNRAIFCLKQDIAAHTDRTLGKVDYTNTMADPRYMADDTPRTMTVSGAEIPYTLSDASGARSLEPFSTLPERLKEYRQKSIHGKTVTLEEEWGFAKTMQILQDFLDEDDSRGIDGMERPEYLKAGMPMLPRNGEPQFISELLWVPGALNFIRPDKNGLITQFSVIAPSGLDAIPEEKKLYSSPIQILSDAADLTDSEQEKLEKALNLWRTQRIPVRKSMDTALMKKIFNEDNGISEEESGFYRINLGGDETGFFMSAVFTLNPGTAYIEYYEYLFF